MQENNMSLRTRKLFQFYVVFQISNTEIWHSLKKRLARLSNAKDRARITISNNYSTIT